MFLGTKRAESACSVEGRWNIRDALSVMRPLEGLTTTWIHPIRVVQSLRHWQWSMEERRKRHGEDRGDLRRGSDRLEIFVFSPSSGQVDPSFFS